MEACRKIKYAILNSEKNVCCVVFNLLFLIQNGRCSRSCFEKFDANRARCYISFYYLYLSSLSFVHVKYYVCVALQIGRAQDCQLECERALRQIKEISLRLLPRKPEFTTQILHFKGLALLKLKNFGKYWILKVLFRFCSTCFYRRSSGNISRGVQCGRSTVRIIKDRKLKIFQS